MKKNLLLLALAGALRAQAQVPATTAAPTELIRAGVALYDAGQYEAAVAKYQQALAADPANRTAQAELGMTYFALNRYDEAIAVCRPLLQGHPDADPAVYITYANSLDATKKTPEALAVYQQGLRRYPTSYMLWFNQGVALLQQGSTEKSLASFERAVALNPRHASSHLLLGEAERQAGRRVPQVLALARFLVLEPTGPRAAPRVAQLDQAMLQGVRQTGERNVTINISSQSLKKPKGKSNDDFSTEEMALSLAGALSLDEKNKDKNPLEKFIDQFTTLCQVLGERGKDAGGGFLHTYYVPYFVEMEKKGFVPAFAYLAHSAAAEAPAAQQWLAAHPAEVQVFQEWSKNYDWPNPAQ